MSPINGVTSVGEARPVSETRRVAGTWDRRLDVGRWTFDLGGGKPRGLLVLADANAEVGKQSVTLERLVQAVMFSKCGFWWLWVSVSVISNACGF